MVVDLKSLTDPIEIEKKVTKYTQCFNLLDKLGADNCVDPEDFDQEDMKDDHFKNLTIADIEDLLSTPQSRPVDQDTAVHHLKDCEVRLTLEKYNYENY